MKRFLSVLLALMMVLSSVSYAIPSAVESFDSAVETPIPVDELFDGEENSSESATLAAVDTKQYGELIAKFTFDNLVSGTSYADAFRATTPSGNALSVVGGVLGTGTNKVNGLKDTTPFIWDGQNNGTLRHAAVVGAQDSNGNKYLQLTGTGSDTRFAIRDYNGGGFAKAGHYIITVDVLSASNTKPISAVNLQGSSGKIYDHVEYVEETVKTGEWSTVVVSHDDSHDKINSETNYTSDQNTKANYVYFLTDLDANEVLGVDNITLWWVPASVSFNVTHDVEGVLEDGTYTIGGGIKTIDEISAVLDPNGAFTEAGYYLAGFRDEDGFYTDNVAFIENGKSYTAVWNKTNILADFNFDHGSETGFSSRASSGTVTVSYENGYAKLDLTNAKNIQLHIDKTFAANSIGDIHIKLKAASTLAYHSNNIYYWGPPTFVSANLPEIGSDWKVAKLNEMSATAIPTINADAITKIRWDISPNTAISNTLYIDYIRIFGKSSASDKNVLINLDGTDSDLNNFKVVVTPTTTAQDIIDAFEATGYNGAYYIKSFKAPDGTILKGDTLVSGYVEDQDILTTVWRKQNFVSESYEFNTLADVTALRSKAIRGNATKNAYHNDMTKFYTFHEADATENVGYVTVNFLNPSDDPTATSTTATYLVQDIGINPYAGSIPAGSFKEFSMRVRFRGDVLNNVFSSYTPTNIRWPELYWFYNNNANNISIIKTTNITGKVGEWMEFHYTAEELGVSSIDVSSLRIDFPDFMPSRAYMDIDYIRFIGAPANVATVDFGKEGIDNLEFNYTSTTTVDELLSNINYTGKEIVVGLATAKNGTKLNGNTLISSLSDDDITLYAVWGPNPYVGEFGELLFEINFNNASTGSIEFGSGLKVLSALGGKTGTMYGASPASFTMNNGSGTNFPALTTEIVERAAGDKYLKATTNANGSSNLFQIYTGNGSKYFNDKDGYIILTYDVLWGDSAASAPHNIAYNRSQAAESNDQNEYFHVTKNGGWGYVVSAFEDTEIGKSGFGGNSQTMLPTNVNYVKIHGDGGVKAGETFGIDNIRLWWVPKTVKVTVVPGKNTHTSQQTFTVNPAMDTVASLISKVQSGNADVSLAGVSLTDGGELLTSDALLSFAYDTTLYPKWSMPAQVTVDMGDNTSVTPVSMSYRGSNTIGDVISKIIDEGDKKLLGLSRTPDGEVLASNELIGTDSEDVTLYAVWETYEYLTNFSHDFNAPIDEGMVVTNSSKNRTITYQDGYMTIGLEANSGYTGTWDTQIYLPISTNAYYNPDKYIPVGVVTGIAARIRYRGTGTASQSLTIDGRSATTFNPASPSNTYIHWAAPNNKWGEGLISFDYNYKTTSKFTGGIPDGEWFTLFFDTKNTNKLMMFDSGVGYMRFDFPYPMPTGTKIDVDYIRIIGDNELTNTYDGYGEFGEKVWEVDFNSAAEGTTGINNVILHSLGAKFNPKFYGANYQSITNPASANNRGTTFHANNAATTILDNGDGDKYLQYTSNAAGNNTFLYIKNALSKPFVNEEGYFVLTYDMKNSSSAATPHTFRFNNQDKIEFAADNIVITENGEWDHVTVYFDKEIDPSVVKNGHSIDSSNDITLVKWHNVSSVKTGETICMDNIVLWYVPKTVPVIIDNSAIGKEETLIENFPTSGISNEELAALLPQTEGVVFNGISKEAGGSLLYENRVQTAAIFHSVWAVDTILTVDMGDNTKLDDMKIQIPAGSSIKVSEIEAKFIDHGDKIFKGLSLTENGTKLDSGYTIAASEEGSITIYALWEDYFVNDFYSVEFKHGIYGVVTESANMSAGKNSKHRSDAKDASGNAAPGEPKNALTWTDTEDGDGYMTFNFVASDYAKAQTEAQGMKHAAVYDAWFEIDTIYGDDKFIPAGTIDKIAIRMRYRGMPETNTKAYSVEANKGEHSFDCKVTEVFAPFFFYTSDSVKAFGDAQVKKTADVSAGSAYRDNWFTVFVDASELKMDEENLYSIRLDALDTMVDGSAIDIDFIRFIVTDEDEKADYLYDAPEAPEKYLSARIKNDDSNRNGLRVRAEVNPITADTTVDLGWMFVASKNWSANPAELTMDSYNGGTNKILVGFTKQDGEHNANFFDENDDYKAFTAVLYNIPVKNYLSPFIVRPFAKIEIAEGKYMYAYGEPHEIKFLEILEASANSEGASEEVIAYHNSCQLAYASYLDKLTSYDSSEVNKRLAEIMSSSTSIMSNLIIPTNDVAPTIIGNIVNTRVWKDGAFTTISISTKDTYPALLTEDNKISDAYAEKPCVYYLSDGIYYIKSLGRSTDAGGNYIGIEKNNPDAMEANVDASAMFLSEIKDVASPFQRVPIDDELTNGKDSWFIGDFSTGTFDFTFQRANSATRTIATGKTATFGDKTKMVAKYKYNDGSYEWVSYAKSQLLKMGLDSNNANVAGGIDFNNLTYVVTNNTTTVSSGTVNQREYEDLLLLVGEVDVPEYINAGTSYTTVFNAHQYNTVIVKTNSSASYVTVSFTRNDGVSGSVKSYFYGTTTDGYRLFEVDMSGIATWHSNIKKLSVSSGGTISYVRLIKDPAYYTTDNLAAMNRSTIFQDTSFDNGFYVRDMDQKLKKPEWSNYTFANNGNTPIWMIDPWYSYDYSNSANKSQYELYTKASPTATSLADDKGAKVVKFNGTKTSTQADGKQYTGDVLSMTLNSRAIYNGMTHTEMKEAGMTYWPHLLIEQSKEICSVNSEANSAGADKIFLEMDIKMTNYVYQKHSALDEWFGDIGTKQLSFLLYTYLRPKANPNDRIWFGAQLLTNSNPNYPTWNRDTGASAYIYCIPQEVVFQGIKNSFYQKVNALSKTGSGTASTNMDWVHISLDVTPYIQTAIDWANREDAFGLGTLTRDDFYFDGVNIGFETHGNIDGTFEIANFNFVAYND